MPPKISRGMMIGELVMNYPSAVEVLFERGFHCIGCGLSAYETLEQGCAAHGYDDAMIDEILEEIKKKVEETGKITGSDARIGEGGSEMRQANEVAPPEKIKKKTKKG